jgi:hypothetical protein
VLDYCAQPRNWILKRENQSIGLTEGVKRVENGYGSGILFYIKDRSPLNGFPHVQTDIIGNFQ